MDAETIGQYRIVETLGQGGMGIVFRARHVASRRAVALKTVRLPAPRWLDSIRREIQALTRVRHPGVVRIVDHGVHAGLPWYAMDLLEGETLRKFGRRIWSPFQPFHGVATPVSMTDEATGGSDASTIDQPVVAYLESRSYQRAHIEGMSLAAAGELHTVLRVMRRICASLAFLHGEGFINRDLKPENVMLVDGRPVIIDFGLTLHHPGGSGREELEVPHGVSGTVPYMSPEQIRGELVDARSDLYAIGCMLYELVVGRPPFSGATRAVMLQHLSAAPTPPSQRVRDLPPQLEQLILRLLEKEVGKRPGYADEVAAELAELSADVPRLTGYPPTRSYLYRPGFVGRDEVVARLAAARDAAMLGRGSFALLGGESGAGKTRIALELTRTHKPALRLVASETALLATDGETRIAPSPLHAFKPLLRAIADECHTGGSEVTERLLGEHRAVLSVYEPLLAQVPAAGPLQAPPALSPTAARKRLFGALSEALVRFARERPLFFVIDDLGWVDEVSVAFLSSLSAELLASTPMFLLCTYRSEDTPAAVSALANLGHVLHLSLSRLGEAPVRSIVADMLALPEPAADFVEFVTREAEGNPFFVAEYLRAAVSERVLYRDHLRTWQVRGSQARRDGTPLTLALPRSLKALIDQRLRSLSTAGQQLCLAAAVLGREIELPILREVSAMPDSTFVGAVDELLRRQVLEQLEPGQLRFAHDKLREVTHQNAQPSELRQLHARAATALEHSLSQGPEAASSWALLGHHYGAAELPEPAVRYLSLAAEHARASSAHGEAARLFSQAIFHASDLERIDETSWRPVVTPLYESYGDLLALGTERVAARDAYRASFERAGGDHVLLSRLYRKVGKTWEAQHNYAAALEQYQLAREVLAPLALDTQERRDEWIQVRLDQLWMYYWIGDVLQMDELTVELAPYMAGGSSRQRARYFGAQMKRNLRRDRYVVSDETHFFAHEYLEVCKQGNLIDDLPAAHFNYGLALLLMSELPRAERELSTALTQAQRSGDVTLQVRCINYLALSARMRLDLDQTRVLAARAEQLSGAADTPVYVGAALANRAWTELRAGRHDLAVEHGQAALRLWRGQAIAFPLEWMARLPLMRISLQEQDVASAVSCGVALLDGDQHQLPAPSEELLRLAAASLHDGDDKSARAALEQLLARLPAGFC